MSECFNGFAGFDCRREIWNGVFATDVYGGSKRLRQLLSIPEDMSGSSFSHKLDGDKAWTYEVEAFLQYSKDPQQYREKWLEQWQNPAGCLELFRRFMASVPEESADPEEQRFIPAARRVSAYLEQVLQQCGSHPGGSAPWIAAGMYALVSFFLQNNKYTTPRMYAPPRDCDPTAQTQGTLVLPGVVMGPPEDEEAPLDFLADLHRRFRENDGKKEENAPAQPEEEAVDPEITPAAARWEKVSLSTDFTIIDPEDMSTRAFRLEEALVKENGRWCCRCIHREIPFEEVDGDRNRKRFLVDARLFPHEDIHIVLLTAARDGSKVLLNTAVFTEDNQMYVSGKHTPGSVTEIDENGHWRDLELEQLLDFCGIGGLELERPQPPVRWKKTVSQWKPEYLEYLIMDLQSMETLPRSVCRDPASGEYRLEMQLPCPGKLIIWEVRTTGCDAEELAAAAYLHGDCGLKQDKDGARQMFGRLAAAGSSAMAFEYGVLLRQEGKQKEAEDYLRRAMEQEAGARFELAGLLKEQGREEEARGLIDALWQQGYRRYGKESIDLFGVYPPEEEE